MKRQVGIESSGHLTFHLEKLSGLISLGPDGRYGLTDDGREALRIVGVARNWNDEGARRKRPVEVRRAVLAGLVVLLVVLAAIAGVQQLRITQLSAPPVGTTLLAGRSFWSTSLQIDELPSDHNFTFIFHGVTFTLGPVQLMNLGVPITVRMVGESGDTNGTITMWTVPGSGGSISGGNGNVSISIISIVDVMNLENVKLAFPDGAREQVPLTQLLYNSSTQTSLGATEVVPWFSAHTNPQVAVTESDGTLTLYVSFGN